MNTKPNQFFPKDVVTIVLSTLTIIFMSLFCYIMKYSLIVPIFLLFLGIHLNYFRKARIKIFFAPWAASCLDHFY